MPTLQPLDQIRAILAMAHLHASARLSLIHAALGVPKNKRGRKQQPGGRKERPESYYRDRYQKLKEQGLCTHCGNANDRLPLTKCTACNNR